MGRPGNFLVKKRFKRGVKTSVGSNRYSHECRACAEINKTGRFESLLQHASYCRRASSVERQDAQVVISQRAKESIIRKALKEQLQSATAASQNADPTPEEAESNGNAVVSEGAKRKRTNVLASEAEGQGSFQLNGNVDPNLENNVAGTGAAVEHRVQPSFVPGGEVTSLQEDEAAPAKRTRGAFDEVARKKVAAVRIVGACLRCKILKKPCDHNTPCGPCAVIKNHVRWGPGCIRDSSIMCNVFAADLHDSLWFWKFAQVSMDSEFQTSLVQIEVWHASDKVKSSMMFSSEFGNVWSKADDCLVEVNLIAGFDKPVQSIKNFFRSTIASMIEDEESVFMKATLQACHDIAAAGQDDLLADAVQLWTETKAVAHPSFFGSITMNYLDSPNFAMPSFNRELVFRQLLRFAEKVAEDQFKSVANGLQKRLEKRGLGEEDVFANVLAAVLVLGSFELMYWRSEVLNQHPHAMPWIAFDPAELAQQAVKKAKTIVALQSINKQQLAWETDAAGKLSMHNSHEATAIDVVDGAETESNNMDAHFLEWMDTFTADGDRTRDPAMRADAKINDPTVDKTYRAEPIPELKATIPDLESTSGFYYPALDNRSGTGTAARFDSAAQDKDSEIAEPHETAITSEFGSAAELEDPPIDDSNDLYGGAGISGSRTKTSCYYLTKAHYPRAATPPWYESAAEDQSYEIASPQEPAMTSVSESAARYEHSTMDNNGVRATTPGSGSVAEFEPPTMDKNTERATAPGIRAATGMDVIDPQLQEGSEATNRLPEEAEATSRLPEEAEATIPFDMKATMSKWFKDINVTEEQLVQARGLEDAFDVYDHRFGELRYISQLLLKSE